MAVVNLLCRVDKNSERVILTPAKITGKKRNINSCLYRDSPDGLVAGYLTKEFITRVHFNSIF